MRLARRTFAIAGAALAAGAAVTVTRGNAMVQSTEEAFPPLGEFVDLNGRRIHYVREGTGPDLVLLHGAGGNLREFTFDLVGRLSDQFRVTVFDRPGMGYSDRVPGVDDNAFATEGDSPLAQAQMLRAASDAIGLKDPIIAGHSFGGIVAMAWAVLSLDDENTANASAVVSLAGVSMPWPGELGRYYRVNGSAIGGITTIPLISAFASDQRISDTIDAIFAPQPVPAGYADYVGARLTLRPAQFRANVRQVNTLRPHVVELAKRYPELSLPIEIVHGVIDTTVPIAVHPYELTKIVASANLTELAGVGHMPHHADPDATVAAIERAATRAGLR